MPCPCCLHVFLHASRHSEAVWELFTRCLSISTILADLIGFPGPHFDTINLNWLINKPAPDAGFAAKRRIASLIIVVFMVAL